ncbi:diguanylate cyclase domain-containing protein [Sphingomonas sp. PR090111-T3T-6A]|uniref:diguanylate cyclase domain-containing protein n=1 Tax=Sphingomonas sp. PR090111-T3T-6A TaxID=685778 RepID=UPI000377AF07|nr:diguanylate cyclase [Sphingomonas sp. PR090111-T3T-6A]
MDVLTDAEARSVLGSLSREQPIMVLLVDDQIVVGEAIRRALIDQPGIEFHYCSDPLDALSVAKKVRPTVILQDLVMPSVNGLDLVREYRGDPVTANIPVIVLSTKEEATVKRDAFRIGANDYLVKLPDTIELVARIRYHSHAYQMQIQRDEAYRALRKSQRELLETNLQLQRLTNVDGLTGLSSRRYFNDYMEMQWRTALRGQYPISLLMIDIDHFKQYNDHYGHLAGDEVLRSVADALRRNCKRATDVAARFGGEEFVIALPLTGAAELEHLAKGFPALIEKLRIPHAASTVAPWVTISVGGASAVPDQENYSGLLEAADKALYQAKRAGRNQAAVGV